MHRWIACVLITCASAQNPPLNPTSNVVLDTTATQGHFAFSFIDIPVGVRVTFSGGYPVQIRCDGDALVGGQLDVDATGSTGGPGAVSTGAGLATVWGGTGCPSSSGTNGIHAGLYGTAMPFDLAGGSPGGGIFGTFFNPSFGCTVAWMNFGGGGGGTLVLEANGVIDISGRVSANGDSGGLLTNFGSGGSLLLRAFGGLTIQPGGCVEADVNPNYVVSAPGIVRLDSYGHPPILLGTVDPPPLALELPYLQETQPPVIGNTWQLRVAAPRGNGVTLAASFQPGSTTNQFGTVGLHLPTAILFTFLPLPGTGHDPLVTYQLAIANDPGLIGVNLWVAGLDWLTTLPPRYTNTIHTIVQ